MWEAWKLYSPATQVFAQIFCQPFQPLTTDSQVISVLERFTCVLYDKATGLGMVNDVQQDLFSRCNKLMDNIPPAQGKHAVLNVKLSITCIYHILIYLGCFAPTL